MSERLSGNHFVVAGLIVLGVLTYWQGATSPALFSDEWGRVGEIAFGRVACPTYDNLFMRPLVGCYIAALHALFGTNFAAYHAISLVWIVVSAILLYLILNRLIPHYNIVSAGAAALFLVYPSNFARLFFERGSYEISLVLFLAAILCWLEWYRSPGLARFLVTQALILASLLLYEAHLGLVFLASALFFYASRGHYQSKRLVHFVPLIIGIFWALGRIFTQQKVGNVHGHVTDDVVVSPAIIATRLYIGFRTVFQWAWTQAVAQYVPYREQPVLLIAPLLVIMALVCLLVLASFRRQKHKRLMLSCNEHIALVRIAAIGLLISLAGQVPMVTAMSPSLSFVASRINVLSSIGAAMTLSTILFYVACWLGSSVRQRNSIYTLSCAPLLLLGIITQLDAQQCANLAWRDQKSLWQQMTILAPNLTEGTNVVLLLAQSEDECMGGATPINGGPYGLTGALRVIYGHEDVRGWFASVEPASRRLVFEPPWWKLIPKERRIVFLYDQSHDVLTLIPEDSAPIGTTCSECIQTSPATKTGWYWLIQ
jgi:hypothetical protein